LFGNGGGIAAQIPRELLEEFVTDEDDLINVTYTRLNNTKPFFSEQLLEKNQ